VTISREVEAQILRYHHVEKWRVGTIASQLGIHYSVVVRVLAQAGLPAITPPRPSKVDPYLPFIRETLEEFPQLTASRLLVMVQERGYRGGASHFRHIVSCHRPRRKAEAYLRLRTLPGDQAQIDWGHFGHLAIGKARRPLMAFVIVLSYSRRIFLRFFLDARMESFLRGHVEAFGRWQGVPRICLYDNLKSAVLERRGDVIRFHPTLLDLAASYRFEPRPVAVARGNEKGRVERAIRYIRSSFFAARSFDGLDDLNRQADAWCDGLAADRPCPEDTARTVAEVFAEEVPHLLPLPDNPYPVLERVEVRIGKTPYARFDGNDYSVPHHCVQRTLTVLADPYELRIVDGQHLLACHQRSWGKGEQIESPAHLKALVEEKSAARRHRDTDRLARAAPAAKMLLAAAAGQGYPLGRLTAELAELLDQYGSAELQAAIIEALDRHAPHTNAVRIALQRRGEERRQPPPVAANLPQHVRDRDVVVRQPRLELYDRLKGQADDGE
jgi:transposase